METNIKIHALNLWERENFRPNKRVAENFVYRLNSHCLRIGKTDKDALSYKDNPDDGLPVDTFTVELMYDAFDFYMSSCGKNLDYSTDHLTRGAIARGVSTIVMSTLSQLSAARGFAKPFLAFYTGDVHAEKSETDDCDSSYIIDCKIRKSEYSLAFPIISIESTHIAPFGFLFKSAFYRGMIKRISEGKYYCFGENDTAEQATFKLITAISSMDNRMIPMSVADWPVQHWDDWTYNDSNMSFSHDHKAAHNREVVKNVALSNVIEMFGVLRLQSRLVESRLMMDEVESHA